MKQFVLQQKKDYQRSKDTVKKVQDSQKNSVGDQLRFVSNVKCTVLTVKLLCIVEF